MLVGPIISSKFDSLNEPKSEIKKGSSKTDSTSTIRLSGQGSINCSNIFNASSLFVFTLVSDLSSMLDERSRIKTMTSGAGEENDNKESPPIVGRAIKRKRLPSAKTRKNKVSHLLTFEILLYMGPL